VNPAAAPDTAAGEQINTVPMLTAMSPLTATVGSGALTLTVSGRDFLPQSTVYWNGGALQTTMVSSTELSVQIPASDLASVGQGTLTVSNDGTSFATYNSMTFSVNPAPSANNQIAVYSAGGNDLVWDANTARLYVSMPGVQGELGDSIAVVDPVAGTVTNSGFIGSDPAKLAFSSDGKTLNVALFGANAIAQLSMPSMTVGNQWNVGGVGTFDGPYYVLDLQAAPGAPGTTAAVMAAFDESPSPMIVQIYDGPTPRGTGLPVLQYPYSSLQWAGDNLTIYAADQEAPQDLLVLGVSGGCQSQPALRPYRRSLLQHNSLRRWYRPRVYGWRPGFPAVERDGCRNFWFLGNGVAGFDSGAGLHSGPVGGAGRNRQLHDPII
jgi:hypothetical protein